MSGDERALHKVAETYTSQNIGSSRHLDRFLANSLNRSPDDPDRGS